VRHDYTLTKPTAIPVPDRSDGAKCIAVGCRKKAVFVNVTQRTTRKPVPSSSILGCRREARCGARTDGVNEKENLGRAQPPLRRATAVPPIGAQA